MTNFYRLLVALSVTLLFLPETTAQITPEEAVKQMGRGINLGNTMEPPVEGGWNNGPVQEYYFDDYKSAGFTTIRIPITWNSHIGTASPYTVNAAWMDRVEQVVDWGLSRGLFIIINAHHDSWIKESYTANNKARFDSLWSQIAVRFKNKSEKLLFEMINEPEPLARTSVDELNARILSIIRKTNPARIVIFSGNRWSNSEELIAAAIPNDPYLIGYFHSYDPWPFGLEGTGSYTFADINISKSKYDAVGNWSATHDIPVLLGEFGCNRNADYNSRMLHYATITEQALNHGMAFTVWDDGGTFQVYLRNTRKWKVMKDILVYTSKESPTRLQAESVSETGAVLSWTNRTTGNDSIVIEKGINQDDFDEYATIAPGASEYLLEDLTPGVYHYFRLKTTKNDTLMYSYPIRFMQTYTSNLVTFSEETFEIFPNPANDRITVKTDVLSAGAKMWIYDMNGKVIFSSPVNRTEISVDLSGLSSGLYLIRIENDHSAFSRKFLKN